MKVILFGPTSLSGKKSSGPTPNGVRWGLQEATPGMIALAAIIVSTSVLLFLEYITQRSSLGSLPPIP